MKTAILALCLALPAAAFAAGESDTPPDETETTTECEEGRIYDKEAGECVDVRDSRLDDDTRFQAVRELAHAGYPDRALLVLAAMDEQTSDRVLTMKGFAHRKAGDRALGMAYYDKALAQNPDNLLARSYMGQAHAEAGEFELARAQLTEIRRRGGRSSWPGISLRLAIGSGQGLTY